MLEKMTGNPWFPGPVPYLAELGVALDELRALEAQAEMQGIPARALRNAKKAEVKDLLLLLCAFVEFIANKHAESAAVIIQSAGFDLKRPTRPRPKDPIRVRQGRTSTQVVIEVKLPGKDAQIHYQRSDDGGRTWIDLKVHQNTRHVDLGLMRGKPYLFRYAYRLRKGERSDWSEPVAFTPT